VSSGRWRSERGLFGTGLATEIVGAVTKVAGKGFFDDDGFVPFEGGQDDRLMGNGGHAGVDDIGAIEERSESAQVPTWKCMGGKSYLTLLGRYTVTKSKNASFDRLLRLYPSDSSRIE